MTRQPHPLASLSGPVSVAVDGGIIMLVPVPTVPLRRPSGPTNDDDAAALVALDQLLAALPALEQDVCASWGPKRQATFAAGRQALRLALSRCGLVDDIDVSLPILRTARGAPLLPPSLDGRVSVSVTHKDSIAGALVRVREADVAIGLDVELVDDRDRRTAEALARQVLLAHEQTALRDAVGDDDLAYRRGVFARFSLKESLYKALDPFVARYVGFLEVEVALTGDEAAFVVPTFAMPRATRFDAVGAIVPVPMGPEVVLTTARVRRH